MKYALITGITKGIGKQIALDLLQKNVNILGTYYNDDKEAHFCNDEFQKISKNFKIIKVDNSKQESINFISNEIDELDFIIHNISKTCRKSLISLTTEEWDDVFNTNLKIPFFLTQRLYPKIKENGKIIFISSILGIYPHSISIPYGVSKSAINMLVKYLAKELAIKNICVNAIAPGFVDTDWHKNKSKNLKQKIIKKISLKKFANVKDISQLIISILDNNYITGQIINIDGGYCLN